MNDAPIKSFAIESRRQLVEEVTTQMTRWAIDDAAAVPANVDVLNGQPLTTQQREQRRQLLERCRILGVDRLRDEAAYTWFNRIAAIRYMEVHDFLPCRMRFFSDASGAFNPQVMTQALDVDIEGVDKTQVAQLVITGDRESLFRYLLLAQCNELANAMPAVFERVGAGMELLLPEHLLRQGSIIDRIVTELPERDAEGNSTDTWENAEVLGWLYQHYNSELKDDFFKSKRKASAKDIGPATQLFTPEWIVRYMVENSLGRLWMLNFPDSRLAESWDYYIAPDAEHEDFIRIEGPEDISLCDPACGSGHILVYAFKLLFDMYIERGYREREIPQLILENNLAGMEIDPRAAQIANLALAMCAREHDRRFFSRGVQADIDVVKPTKFDRDESGNVIEVPENAELLACPQLIDALEHLDEIGSLYNPSELELQALRADAERFKQEAENDLFKANLSDKLQEALKVCEVLARKFTCVVANPPYMGSSSFSPFMSKWIKKHYPDVKSDLFSAFAVRIMSFADQHGEIGLMTPFVWMFIGSYEKLRKKIIDEKTITSLIQLEYSGFAGATVPICTFTLHNSLIEDYDGGYVRLSDFVGAANQAPKARETIANPSCGYFYRRKAKTFTRIPGTPIAYWASDAVIEAFEKGSLFNDVGHPKVGMQTSNNDLYLRLWWEGDYTPNEIGKKWIKYLKGGDYRKWYGNLSWLLLYKNSPEWILRQPNARVLDESFLSMPKITWTDLTSGANSFRYAPDDTFYDISGHCFLPPRDSQYFLLAYSNSSVFSVLLKMFNSTMHCQVGDVAKIPYLAPNPSDSNDITRLAEDEVFLSKIDYDSFETSWDFKRHPLL